MGEVRPRDAGRIGESGIELNPDRRATLVNPRHILVVKLSDIGDVLTATPALRALRESFPATRLDALVPPNSAPVLAESPLVNDVIVFDKFQYDRPLDAIKPSSLATLVRFARELCRQCYDCLVILHHLTTRWGALKYAALALTRGDATSSSALTPA